MGRKRQTIPLGIRDMTAAEGDHIAYFWEDAGEFAEAVGFLLEGLRRGDHTVVFGHEEANERVCGLIEEHGYDCEQLRAEGRLSVLGPESTSDRMLERIGKTFQSAVDSGAGMIRLLGNIGWGKDEWPGETEILRFEARVTSAAEQFPCVVVCMYDVNSSSGSVILHGAFQTHPLTISGNLIRENPVCVPMEEYLERLAARAKSRSE